MYSFLAVLSSLFNSIDVIDHTAFLKHLDKFASLQCSHQSALYLLMEDRFEIIKLVQVGHILDY